MTTSTIDTPDRERRSTGAAGMLRAVLRRDRIVLPLWMGLTLLVLISSAAATATTYPTESARTDRLHQVREVPMFPLFQSMAFSDSPSALAAQQVFGATTLLAALGAILLVVRHTRSEEQKGCHELLGSTPIGRSAPLTATLMMVLSGGAGIGMVGAAVMAGSGHPVVGSVMLGAMVIGAAWVGATVAAVMAQVSEQARTAAALSYVIVFVMHFLRGSGHLADAAVLTMLSPWGWLEGVRPFAGDRWWMLLPVVALVTVLGALAVVLSARRDLGAGLIPARRGRTSAAPSLHGPLSLALRQNSVPFMVWAGTFAVVGLAFGGVGTTAVSGYADSAWMLEYAQMIGMEDPARAFFVYVVFVLVFPVVAYALLTVLRLRADETSGTAELLLSAPVSRMRWAMATALMAFLGSGGLLTVLGVTLMLTAQDVEGLLPLTLSLVPAVWVLIGIAMLCLGFIPRAAAAVAWCALGVGIAGELLVKAGLPDLVYLALSPIAHVSPYYATAHSWLVLVVVAVVTTATGLFGIRRRDLSR